MVLDVAFTVFDLLKSNYIFINDLFLQYGREINALLILFVVFLFVKKMLYEIMELRYGIRISVVVSVIFALSIYFLLPFYITNLGVILWILSLIIVYKVVDPELVIFLFLGNLISLSILHAFLSPSIEIIYLIIFITNILYILLYKSFIYSQIIKIEVERNEIMKFIYYFFLFLSHIPLFFLSFITSSYLSYNSLNFDAIFPSIILTLTYLFTSISGKIIFPLMLEFFVYKRKIEFKEVKIKHLERKKEMLENAKNRILERARNNPYLYHQYKKLIDERIDPQIRIVEEEIRKLRMEK